MADESFSAANLEKRIFHLSGNLGSPIAGQENLKTLGRAQNPPMEK
jgi:hypothetical protein